MGSDVAIALVVTPRLIEDRSFSLFAGRRRGSRLSEWFSIEKQINNKQQQLTMWKEIGSGQGSNSPPHQPLNSTPRQDLNSPPLYTLELLSHVIPLASKLYAAP